MKILNQSKDTVIAEEAQVADTIITRLVGLLKKRTLSFNEALVITQCRSIHMFFMRFSIDAIFVSKAHVVVGLVKNIKPFRMSPYFFKSSYVIEAPVGTIDKTKTALGDNIVLAR